MNKEYIMKGLLIGISIFLLVLSGCVDGDNIVGKKINSFLDKIVTNGDNLAIEPELVPRRDEPTEIDECVVIDEEGEYVLTEDIEDSDELKCMDIQASNVIFDCNGHTIGGNPEDDNQRYTYGIYAGNEDEISTDITIRDCVVTRWDAGIYIGNVEGGLLEDLNVNSNHGRGIDLRDIENFNIRNNNIEDNGYRGIILIHSSNNEIRDSIISNNGLDFSISPGREDSNCDNVIEDITGTGNKPILYYNERVEIEDLEDVTEVILCNADGSEINGLTIDNGEGRDNGLLIERTDNAVLSNINIDNSRIGISLDSSDNNIIRDSSSTNSDYDGIIIMDSSNNEIYDSHFNNNDHRGVYLRRSESTTLINSHIGNNGRSGVDINSAREMDGTGLNIIINNIINDNGRHNIEKGIKITGSHFNTIMDNEVNGNNNGIYLRASNSNNIISNIFCYNDEIDIERDNGENNEFLYNQFDTIEGLEIEGMPCDIEEHEIELKIGWNLISSYLVPYFTDIEAIFGKLGRSGDIDIVKDEQGRFFSPENDFNSIPEWNPQEGYQVKMNRRAILVIKGEEHVNPRFELEEGWNFMGYPLTEPSDVRELLNPLVDEGVLDIIKNGRGNFYIPRWRFNNIPEMRAGEGYKIKVTEDTVLNFGGIEEEYPTMFYAIGEEVVLNTRNIDNDLIDNNIFYYNLNFERIKLGGDDDEPFVVENGFVITSTDVDEEELDRMRDIRFLYDIDDESHIIRITDIDTHDNRTDFYVETTRTSYVDQEWISGEDTSFEFLPNAFRLNFYHDPSYENTDQITFTEITDEENEISRINTFEGAAITLSEQSPEIIINQIDNDEGRITMDLVYSEENQEIDIRDPNIEGDNEWLNDVRFIITRPEEGSGTDYITIIFPER